MLVTQKRLILLIILFNHNYQIECSNSVYEFLFDNLSIIRNFLADKHLALQNHIQNAFEQSKLINVRQENSITHATHDEQEKEKPDPVSSTSAHTMTTPQLAAAHGRIVETHVTFTMDGYILTLHRLRPNEAKDDQQAKQTVLLHHGLLGSSADWILLGPTKSLPYILSDAGFDVWLANARGNYYSRGHLSMQLTSDEYWNFSWQEIGEYDLPAVIDYIRKTKNSTAPIDYIGHSMGATALLVLLSVEQNYSDYFRMAILLAPLAFMTQTMGPFQKLASMEKSELMALLGIREFMPTRETTLSLRSKMCNNVETYCKNPLFFLAGCPLQAGAKYAELIDQLHEYVPAGGSTKTITHYLELISSKTFHHFGKPDWTFNMQSINIPMIILSSNDDKISNVNDNQMLYHHIVSPVVHIVITDQNVSHTEFVFGFNVDVLLYNKIRSLLNLGPDVIRRDSDSNYAIF